MDKKTNSLFLRLDEATYQKVQRARQIYSKHGQKPISNAEAIRRLVHEGAAPLTNKILASDHKL